MKPEELQKQQLEPEEHDNSKYNPSKRHRMIRRKVYERFYYLRDEPARIEAEEQWAMADAEYGMVRDEVDQDNWHSQLHLPDAFAAVQAQAQEDVERKARPTLVGTESSDEPKEQFANAVITYNMNNTGFDYQYFLAKLSRTIRGTAFLMDYWRDDRRTVKDPVDVDEDGNITYKEREIIDFDDDYTEWVPNEYIYIDEKAKHIDEAVDMVRRDIINIDEFHRIYGSKPGFFDTEYVVAGGDTSTRSLFKLPSDITMQDVEVLHYLNKSTDSTWVVANNVTICDDPLQSKHKQLPIAAIYQYRIPGQFWGIGIPKVIHHLSEERRSIRNLNLDRQKIIIGGAFLHNSAFDIDDEDEEIYPGKMISVDTNGQPVNQAIQQLQMTDVPSSSFKVEEILQEDMRRAHGIDDRIQGVNVGGTATEAAILKESSLKRVNLISITAEMDAIIRIGRLKWSNIQFFYGIPRMEKITENNEDKERKVYRKISIKNKQFKIVDKEGRKALSQEDVQGNSALTLDPKMNKYMEGDFDITVDADIFTPVSKAIEQTKKTELFSMLTGNPATLAIMDVTGATADVMTVNNIEPEKWLKNANTSKHDMMMLASSENLVMSAGQPLNGTKDATEDHTLIHLMFTQSEEFKQSSHEIQQIITDHIMQEHDNNPATGASADLMGKYGLTSGEDGGANSGAQPPGMGTPFAGENGAPNTGTNDLAVGAGNGSEPQAQVADIQPTNFSNQE